MADLGMTFDSSEVVDDNNFELIPPGEYLMQVTESDLQPTKSGDGRILKLVWEIVDGPLAGRKIWQRLNIVNPNVQAQSIAQQTLKRAVEAMGMTTINDSEELHYKPVIGKVKIRQDKTGNYSDQNDIQQFRSADGGVPASKAQPHRAAPPTQQRPAAQTARPPQQAARAATGNRPWA